MTDWLRAPGEAHAEVTAYYRVSEKWAHDLQRRAQVAEANAATLLRNYTETVQLLKQMRNNFNEMSLRYQSALQTARDERDEARHHAQVAPARIDAAVETALAKLASGDGAR